MNIKRMSNKFRLCFLFGITFWTTVVKKLVNAFNFPRVERVQFVFDFNSVKEKRKLLFINIVYMFLMADKISFIIKTFLTNVTLIWPDFVMDHSNMSAQVTLHPKGLGTLFTLVKSFSCMMRLVI